MAQKDAMEQAKEALRQMIKYRFWISISVAALFALIAYFVGSGPIRAKADTAKNKIITAEKTVKQYASLAIPTKDYKPIVLEKTQVLTKDVNTAWKELFDRQAPLLTWPESVQERFRKWGRQWPEKEEPRKIELAIVDYIEAYPAFVSMVYKTFNPFDYETGEGVVAAPPEAALLRPAQFDPEHLPGLGKVWAAQERLWIQRTLLEVVAQVNKNSKTWDTAVIREIQSIDVGNSAAQDQRSIAKNETLEEAPSIHAPGEEEPAAAADAGGGGAGVANVGIGGGKFSAMAGRGGSMGMGGGGLGAGETSETVFYVKAAMDKGQYKIMPVVMTVLIEQDHVQDFLVELENSPMSIQVMDFELLRPTARVAKPEKGSESAGGFSSGGMGMGMMTSGGGMQMYAQRMTQRMSGGAYGGMAGMMQNDMSMMMMQRQGGMMSGTSGMGTQKKRQGKDVRGVKREEVRTGKEKAAAQAKGPSLFDPYYGVVQVTVYGQARFFKPPPVEESAEPSPGEAAAEPAASRSPATPSGSAAAAGAPSQSPPAPADRPEQKSAAPKAADHAAANGDHGAEAGKPAPKDGPAPKAEDDAGAGKPAPKAGAVKNQSKDAPAKP